MSSEPKSVDELFNPDPLPTIDELFDEVKIKPGKQEAFYGRSITESRVEEMRRQSMNTRVPVPGERIAEILMLRRMVGELLQDYMPLRRTAISDYRQRTAND